MILIENKNETHYRGKGAKFIAKKAISHKQEVKIKLEGLE